MKKIFTKFYNQEALSYREARDLFDPIDIKIYIVDSDNSNIARPQPKRVSQGVYYAEIDTDMFVDKATYDIIWVYSAQPGDNQIVRNSFRFDEDPTPITGMCRVYGTIEKSGFPSSGDAIFYSVVKNGYSVQFTQSNDKASSNVFGEWSVFLKQGDQAYVVIPSINSRKLFLVPDVASIAYDDLVELQTTVVTDSFGNTI
jgi:hypothetical protein